VPFQGRRDRIARIAVLKPKSEYRYIGPAFLCWVMSDSTVRRFRGRIVRHEVTGAYRFYVNRMRRRKFPEGWPDADEWTDEFDVKDVEWLGQKPEGV
jgi:hypothetical protein